MRAVGVETVFPGMLHAFGEVGGIEFVHFPGQRDAFVLAEQLEGFDGGGKCEFADIGFRGFLVGETEGEGGCSRKVLETGVVSDRKQENTPRHIPSQSCKPVQTLRS